MNSPDLEIIIDTAQESPLKDGAEGKIANALVAGFTASDPEHRKLYEKAANNLSEALRIKLAQFYKAKADAFDDYIQNEMHKGLRALNKETYHYWATCYRKKAQKMLDQITKSNAQAQNNRPHSPEPTIPYVREVEPGNAWAALRPPADGSREEHERSQGRR